MIDAVTNGKPGTAMAGWKTQLSESQIGKIVDYIRVNFMTTQQVTQSIAVSTQNPAGQKIYAETCSVCHGEDGSGALWGKTSLNPQPVNFTDPVATKYLTRERMIASVTNGRPGTAMTAFASQLSTGQVEAVVDYIQSAFIQPEEHRTSEQQTSEHAASTVGMAVLHGQTEAIDNTHRSVIGHETAKKLNIELSGNAATGKAYFIQNCIACHGINGDGKGPRAYFIFPKPRNFQDPAFNKSLSRPELFNAIKNGVLGREMPAWGKVLSDQQIMDITEYIFQTFIKAEQDNIKTSQKAQ
jgi:mono/diheme cytochrome c family protein